MQCTIHTYVFGEGQGKFQGSDVFNLSSIFEITPFRFNDIKKKIARYVNISEHRYMGKQ